MPLTRIANRSVRRSLLWIGADETPHLSAHPEHWYDLSRVSSIEAAANTAIECFDALVLDAATPRSGRDSFARLREIAAELPPVALSLPHFDGVDEGALRRAGFAAVIIRGSAPALGEFALETLDRLQRERRGPRRSDAGDGSVVFGTIRSRDPAMRTLLHLAKRSAPSNATLLLRGETGSGKEVLARAIHDASGRVGGPFLAVNCAALPEALLESELFGHVRGSFTGAERDHPGLFEAADGGTLFLDEIGEAPLAVQTKLLRVLQEREVRPVGGTETRAVDVRVLAATHRRLRGEIERERFRSDLFYRLAVVELVIPPLRERRADLLPIARRLLARHAERENKRGLRFAPEAEALLEAHAWPGNLRELDNEIQRAATLADAEQRIGAHLLSDTLRGALGPEGPEWEEDGEQNGGDTLRARVERFETWVIREILAKHSGRKAITARELGLTREGLYKKMKRLGVG